MRLPPFLTEKALIGAVLDASDAGAALLKADVDRRNDQLSYRTADEGLRRWERDLSLPSDGDLLTRRARIYAALTGGRTLTVEELEKLALTLSGAQEAVVTEKYSRYQVILSALFDGEAGDLTALRAAVERRKPAHLDIKVQSTLPTRDIVYYGTATPLSVVRDQGNGVSTGEFALYGGGINGNTVYSTVDVYDEELVHTTAQPLLSNTTGGGAAMAGNMAVFAGGDRTNNYSEATPTAYSQELTRSAISGLSVDHNHYAGAVSNGPCAVFGGGYKTSRTISAKVTAVNELLTWSNPADFSVARGYYGAAKAGDCVLFAGGYNDNSSSILNSVEAYGAELEKLAAPPALPAAVHLLGAAEAGDYAVFCGGSGQNGFPNAACAYSQELTRIALEDLSVARMTMQSVAFCANALFAGGKTETSSSEQPYATAERYSDELVHTVLTDISVARSANATNEHGAVVGDFALICGGRKNSTTYYNAVDVFTVE